MCVGVEGSKAFSFRSLAPRRSCWSSCASRGPPLPWTWSTMRWKQTGLFLCNKQAGGGQECSEAVHPAVEASSQPLWKKMLRPGQFLATEVSCSSASCRQSVRGSAWKPKPWGPRWTLLSCKGLSFTVRGVHSRHMGISLSFSTRRLGLWPPSLPAPASSSMMPSSPVPRPPCHPFVCERSSSSYVKKASEADPSPLEAAPGGPR